MAYRKWSAGETVALIDAWRPLRNRRRDGESDVWVPASQRTRARSTRSLATADWRAVATAVKKFHTDNNLDPSRSRSHRQCQRRVERLKNKFGEEQLDTPSWYGFVPVLYNNTAGGCGLRVLANAAMEAHGRDVCGGGAAGGQPRGGKTVAEDGAAAAEVSGGEEMEMGVPVGAATDLLKAPIFKKRRTGPSTSTSAGGGDGRAPSVKEELVREANARHARVDEGRAPAAAVAAEMAAALAKVIAAQSNDVAVVTDLLKNYTDVTMKRIELQSHMVAALAAMGGAAVPEPDAARA